MMTSLHMLADASNSAFGTLDLVLFLVAVVGVIWLGICKAKGPKEDAASEDKEKGAADYFLAGRGLTWWLVGFSLIAANISTEQFVGMSGQAADWLGLAVASWEWAAAITLVVVAFCFLPKLLRGGVYTIPEFLEYRYSPLARTCMAVATLLVLVGVPTATVIFSGSKVITVFFQGYSFLGLDFSNIMLGCFIIAFSGAIYVFVGGLKACAWTDLIWGAALIAGGGVVAYYAIDALGGMDANHLWETRAAASNVSVDQIANASAFDRIAMLNSAGADSVSEGVSAVNGLGDKLHMARPADDASIPWTALLLGMWIPNFFYWGLNQYIMQRTLASKSLAEGQKGIVFAAFLKLVIPFIVVIPGILAYNLYSTDLRTEALKKNMEDGDLVAFVGDVSTFKGTIKDENGKVIDLSFIKEDKVTKDGEGNLKAETVKTKVVPMTDSFIVLHTDIAEKIVEHNISVAYGAGAKTANQTEADTARKNAAVAFEKVKADLANTETNRSHRMEVAKEVVAVNDSIVKAMEQANKEGLTTVAVANKLVGYDFDAAFPTLLKRLLKPGLSWFVLAALFGAVVSSLASMLNSASTIFTMDIYHKIRKNATPSELVRVGKFGVLGCVLIALCIAPMLSNPKFGGIFNFVQEFQGFISPGALCVFLFGFFVPKCPRFFGWVGIVLNVILYGALKMCCPEMVFLNRMSVCFGTIIAIGLIATIINALRGGEAIVLPANNKVALESPTSVKVYGLLVVVATVVLYVIFW